MGNQAKKTETAASEQALGASTADVEALEVALKAATERADAAEKLLEEVDLAPLKRELDQTKKDLSETQGKLKLAEQASAGAAKLKARVDELAAKNKQLLNDVAVAEEAAKRSRAEVAEYRERLERSSMSALPALGKNSYEVVTNVTILDSQDVRIDPRKGDVVTMEPAEKLAEKLGGKCKVYQVTQSTIDELAGAKFIRQ